MPNKPHPSSKDLTRSWPDVPCTDPAGVAARTFVVNLRAAMGDKSIRRVAADAGIDEGTVRRVLDGSAWPHFRAMVLLEDSLGVRLHTR